MRIITGQYKGRHFDIPRTFKARPTTDFAKENIFNVMMGYIDFEGASALDLFAGTGSISLELLSRGCAEVVSVEMDRDHARFIQQCVGKLNWNGLREAPEHQLERKNNGNVPITPLSLPSHSPLTPFTLIKSDVFRFLKSCKRQFDFIFADPPYALPALDTIPDLVLPLLKEDGVFVFEHGKQNGFSQHPRFVEHRQYGSVNFSIFK